MTGICDGRVVIVTGGARGIGRGHATLFAREGARVVVNDWGAEVDGTGGSSGPAGEVVDEIRAGGGEAIANGEDVADWQGAQRLVEAALDNYGQLDVVVNNAGILRDRMLVNMEEQEWDEVIRVHLKGTAAGSHAAAAHWRERSKAGTTVDARIINTTSVSGIYGNPGQTNYGAAKMGIAAFTIIAARELGRYGVTVNGVAPGALTRLTEDLGMGEASDEGKEQMNPRWVAPLVTWLASADSKGISGRIFEASGQMLAVAEGWHRGPSVEPVDDPTKVGPIVTEMGKQARLNAGMNGQDMDGGVE